MYSDYNKYFLIRKFKQQVVLVKKFMFYIKIILSLKQALQNKNTTVAVQK